MFSDLVTLTRKKINRFMENVNLSGLFSKSDWPVLNLFTKSLSPAMKFLPLPSIISHSRCHRHLVYIYNSHIISLLSIQKAFFPNKEIKGSKNLKGFWNRQVLVEGWWNILDNWMVAKSDGSQTVGKFQIYWSGIYRRGFTGEVNDHQFQNKTRLGNLVQYWVGKTKCIFDFHLRANSITAK